MTPLRVAKTLVTDILGVPHATLFVAVDEGSELDLTVKLSHVGPDGRATLICLGSAKAY